MPGLLDGRGGFDDPLTMGLLGASQALLTHPSQGGGLGAAFAAFPAAQQAAMKNQYLQQQMQGQEMEAKLRQMQLVAAMKKMDDETKALDYMQKRMGGWNPNAQGALQAEAKDGGQLGPTNAAAARMPASAGAQFPFGLDEVNTLTRLGIPGLWDQYKFFNTPQELRAGSMSINRNTGERTFNPNLEKGMTFGPDGSVINAPGYVQASAAQTTASEMAKAPFAAPIRITGPDGREQLVRLDQFVGLTGGLSQPGNQPGGAAPRPGAPSFAGQPPQLGGGVWSGETNQSRDDRQLANESSKLINASWIKKSDETIKAGEDAGKSIADMQLLRNMNLSTGLGTEQAAFVKNLLRGVHPSLESYAARVEQFGSITTDTTLQKQLEQAGVATKSDTALAAKVGPSLAKTPQANAFAIDYIEAVARVKELKGRYYQTMRAKAQESGETNLAKIDERWSRLQQANPGLSIFGQPSMQRWAPAQ